MSDQHGPEGHHPGRSHVTLQAMRSHVQPGSFPLLLAASLLLYGLNGLPVDLPANAIVGRVVMACAGLYVLSASRTTLWLGLLVVALSITFEAHLWTLDPRVLASFQYFSTITLTTVGFGDIVPVTPAARLVTGLEAMVGQLYLAVVIATLMGRVAARRP